MFEPSSQRSVNSSDVIAAFTAFCNCSSDALGRGKVCFLNGCLPNKVIRNTTPTDCGNCPKYFLRIDAIYRNRTAFVDSRTMLPIRRWLFYRIGSTTRGLLQIRMIALNVMLRDNFFFLPRKPNDTSAIRYRPGWPWRFTVRTVIRHLRVSCSWFFLFGRDRKRLCQLTANVTHLNNQGQSCDPGTA